MQACKTTHPTGRLRVLETTDLHMQLLDYDYFADRPDSSIGLIGLVDKITALRCEEDVTTLLCDNGDLIQGNPLADYVAMHGCQGQTHPMIAALNLLQYDAMTLGNHEFDYGLPFLRDLLSKATFPIVSANITCQEDDQLAAPFQILKRDMLCDDGVRRPIRIGITGFGPPQIADWDDRAKVQVEDIVVAARKVVPKMRDAGADLIVALCHSGISVTDHIPRMENAAIPLAGVDGIDVLLLGHTHEAFPDPAISAVDSIDYANGHLLGKPAVMATFCGKSLGDIDLTLQWADDTWTITQRHVQLRPAEPSKGLDSPIRQKLRALVNQSHTATLSEMRAPIAHTDIPIYSYFATVRPDLSQQLLARATQEALQKALGQTEFATLPLLAAKSSYRFGGRSGLGHYIDLPAGPITLRDAAAIFPFSDKLCAVRRTGQQLRLWLERSAAHYNQIQPGQAEQPLINPLSAGYNCDTIYGLSYQIDVTQPARFDVYGNQINAGATRIVQMKYQGTLVSDSDVFVVATNSFRAKGGGGFPEIDHQDIIYTSSQSVRQHLIDYLKKIETVNVPAVPTWSFAPIAQTSAIFASAPEALHHLDSTTSYIGPGEDGFSTFRLTF